MARKKIREFEAKKLLAQQLKIDYQAVLIAPETDLGQLSLVHPWLNENRLTAKPDQMFGKRKKLGLVLLNAAFGEVKEYLQNHRNREITIGKATNKLTHFLIEPFIEHEEEYFISITSGREFDNLVFSSKGGVDIEENWGEKITALPFKYYSTLATVTTHLPPKKMIESMLELHEKKHSFNIPKNHKQKLIEFINDIYQLFRELDFTYLEINPFTIKNNRIHLLDTVAEVDDCSEQWKDYSFPRPFGRKTFPEEEYIANIDKNSGASLKLTILNPERRIWNILSGGGASIIYLDAITNLGKANEIANYGEYSGNPSAEESYQYAKTILGLMTRSDHPEGKILLIGGAIANFTDIEKTFQGIIKALLEYKEKLQKGKISIYVRRGGPNYEKGLQLMKNTELGIGLEVFGPEISLTKIVALAGEKLK